MTDHPTTIDGQPPGIRRARRAIALDEAARHANDARRSLREAFQALQKAGLHHEAESMTTAIDAVDAVGQLLVEGEPAGSVQ